MAVTVRWLPYIIHQKGHDMKKINKILEVISVILLSAMLVLVILEVIWRYVLKLPLTWSQEFARLFYIFMVYLLLPVLEYSCSQLHVAYFFDRIPYKIRKVLYFITCGVYIVFLLVLAYGAYKCAHNSATMLFSSIKWLKMWVMYVPVIIGALIGIIMVIYRMVHYKESLDIYAAENATDTGKEE